MLITLRLYGFLKYGQLKNIILAVKVLDYPSALKNTAILALISMVLQIFATSLAGYSFSRLKTRFSNILFVLVILTIVNSTTSFIFVSVFVF